MTTDSPEQCASEIVHPAHARCVLCGQENPYGFNLNFRKCDDGGVEGFFKDNGHCEGYPNMMHGGIISLLLDGAMTNCLFVHGRTGVTARMELAFRHPVRSSDGVTVRAWIERQNHPVYRLKAQLLQEDQVKVTAKAVFMDRSELNPTKDVS
ncbi:MAG: PaaI family thioesterase [Lentisphaeria bacterium]|nr:PaaI family thioesterase [Lentisphaeria bacterium]